MTIIAIEFNDAALLAAGPGGVLAPGGRGEPGYATVSGATSFGAAAWRQARLRPRDTHNRFWRELSFEPIPGTTMTSADLVHGHLESLWQTWSDGVDGAVFVVPAYWSQEQLGLLLGIAEELAIPVFGLVDSAVASTRSRYETDVLLHVEASLHDIAVTRIRQDNGAAVDFRHWLDDTGIERMERAIVESVAAGFLEHTRFDPLHDASSEQALYDGLDDWLHALQRSGSVTATIDRGGDEYAVPVDRDGLVSALSPCVEPVLQHLRSHLTSGSSVAIQVTDRLARFPGVVDAFRHLEQAEIFVLEPAAAARGALGRAGQFRKINQGGVAYKTMLRWDREAVVSSVPDRVAGQPTGTEEVTHVLHAGRLYRIGDRPVSIGSELSPGEYGIELPAGNRGISRRHCSIRIGKNGVELVDRSRFGTRLNGYSIIEAAVLRAGDVVSIGEPPVDLQIVTEVMPQEEEDGA